MPFPKSVSTALLLLPQQLKNEYPLSSTEACPTPGSGLPATAGHATGLQPNFTSRLTGTAGEKALQADEPYLGSLVF